MPSPPPGLPPAVQLAEHVLAGYGLLCVVWVLARTWRHRLAQRRLHRLRHRLAGGGVVVGR